MKKLQDAFQKQPNVRENYGPAYLKKTENSKSRDIVSSILAAQHVSHIHVSSQKNQQPHKVVFLICLACSPAVADGVELGKAVSIKPVELVGAVSFSTMPRDMMMDVFANILIVTTDGECSPDRYANSCPKQHLLIAVGETGEYFFDPAVYRSSEALEWRFKRWLMPSAPPRDGSNLRPAVFEAEAEWVDNHYRESRKLYRISVTTKSAHIEEVKAARPQTGEAQK